MSDAAKFGPFRLAAVEEQRQGRCAMCDSTILPQGPKKQMAKYTCHRKECRQAWSELCRRDAREALKLAGEAIGRAEAEVLGDAHE